MNKLNKAKYIMHQLHDGVKEDGQALSDRIQAAVDKIEKFYDGQDKEDVMIACYLQKVFDRKSIHPKFFEREDKLPFGFYQIKNFFDYPVARTVFALSIEPDDRPVNASITPITTMMLAKQHLANCRPDLDYKNISNAELEARAVALWTKELPTAAQVIFLANISQDFETTREKVSNLKQPLAWYAEHYRTEMYVADELKDACPSMYSECVKIKDEGVRRVELLERSVQKERQKLEGGNAI